MLQEASLPVARQETCRHHMRNWGTVTKQMVSDGSVLFASGLYKRASTRIVILAYDSTQPLIFSSLIFRVDRVPNVDSTPAIYSCSMHER